MVTGCGQNRRRIIAVRLVELVVVVLGVTETVDDVAEQQVKLWDLARLGLAEVTEQLVDHLILRRRTGGAAAVSESMKYQLLRAGYRLPRGAGGRPHFRRRAGDVTEHLLQGQLRLGAAARCGKGQRVNLVLTVELVDDLVRGAVGGVRYPKGRGILGACRLRKHRAVEVPGGGLGLAPSGGVALSAWRHSNRSCACDCEA